MKHLSRPQSARISLVREEFVAVVVAAAVLDEEEVVIEEEVGVEASKAPCG